MLPAPPYALLLKKEAELFFHCLRHPREHPNIPVSPTLVLLPLASRAPAPAPTCLWRSPSNHSAPLEAFPGLVPSGSYLSCRAFPRQKPASRPHTGPTASWTLSSHTQRQQPTVTLAPDALGLKPWAAALRRQGSTTSGWRFATSQAPNCPGSPQASCVALVHPEPGPVPRTLPPCTIPHPTHFLSSLRPLTRKGLGVFAITQSYVFPFLEPGAQTPCSPPPDSGAQAPSTLIFQVQGI